MKALVVAVLTALLLAIAPPAHASPTSVILEGHGFVGSLGCPNAATTFPDFAAVLRDNGDTRTPVGINWLCSDKGGLDIKPYGRNPDPNSWNANTKIEDIGYALAWAVYQTYTRNGVAVSMICHSLCGVYWRYAVTHSGVDADFPPPLLVDSTVTYSTPYKGWDVNTGLMGLTCGPYVQCQEMKPGSPFLTSLAAQPAVPSWTCVGGSPNDSVATIASACGVPADRRIDYYDKSVVNYSHPGYMTDASEVENVTAKINGVVTTGVGHSLREGWKAIR